MFKSSAIFQIGVVLELDTYLYLFSICFSTFINQFCVNPFNIVGTFLSQAISLPILLHVSRI